MLDEKFNAKLADIGLAEIYDHDYGSREVTVPAGTMGYLAPEYAFSGIPAVKANVLSFGMVVMEVATGRKLVRSQNGCGLCGKRRSSLRPLMGRFDRMKMEWMLRVGLLCAHPD